MLFIPLYSFYSSYLVFPATLSRVSLTAEITNAVAEKQRKAARLIAALRMFAVTTSAKRRKAAVVVLVTVAFVRQLPATTMEFATREKTAMVALTVLALLAVSAKTDSAADWIVVKPASVAQMHAAQYPFAEMGCSNTMKPVTMAILILVMVAICFARLKLLNHLFR